MKPLELSNRDAYIYTSSLQTIYSPTNEAYILMGFLAKYESFMHMYAQNPVPPSQAMLKHATATHAKTTHANTTLLIFF